MVDVDDVTNCPAGNSCTQCGSTEDLIVAPYDTPSGVFCLTVCDTHMEQPPTLGQADTARAVLEHCQHLGCDLEEMAEARRQEH